MIGIRQLLIIALLIAGIWLFRRLQRRFAENRLQRLRKKPIYQETVRCAHCGTHLLRSKAINGSKQDFFCNEAHKLAQQDDTDH